MRKIFTFFLALVAGVGTVFAGSGTCGLNLTWELTDGTLYIRGTGEMYDYYDVYAEGNQAPWRESRAIIKNISISEGVTSIGISAFEGCENLTSVRFYGNTLKKIGSYAFQNCTALLSMTIPNGVEEIGPAAFYGCYGMIALTVPNSVTEVGTMAFQNVINILYNGSLTDSPWGARFINGYVDGNIVYSNESKTTLWACSHVAKGEIDIPSSVTSIWTAAFSGCSELTSITIPQAITTIEDYVFNDCKGLTSIEIPAAVETIGDWAFFGCRGLTYIICNAVTPPNWTGSHEYTFNKVNKSIPLYVPFGSAEKYRNNADWSQFTNIIEMEEPVDTRIKYQLVDLSKEAITAGQYLIVFDDNKAHAEVGTKDLIESSDELTIENGIAYVPEETACAVTIAPLGTDSFSILLADGVNYLDLQVKNSVASSATPSGFAITDGEDQKVQIAKYLASEGKNFVLQYNTANSGYFRMYSTLSYTLPRLFRLIGDAPTAIEQITNDQSPMTNKVLRNGMLYIIHNGTMYNIQGIRVK